MVLLSRFTRTPARLSRLFTTSSSALAEKALPPRRVVPETEITESFLKGSGPGGQKINKTNSAVQLKHLPSGLVVKCQETRSRQQNRSIARRLLAEKLEEMEKGDQSRTAIKAERARVKKASASKKTKRKYRKLAEEKSSSREGDGHDSESEIEPRSGTATPATKMDGRGREG